ncbi:hypothetical protein [Stenotrophomonas nematodicola]|uniref:hypothetical protein n=1 Tax=Stenotrophomonas nematodicola TaxID=2656746 RepID=UPI001291CD25|nr:hypothetical protein [Stenotrophomonas nematodicola]
MKGHTLLALGMLGLSACASMPTASELATADYGPPVSQEDAEAQAKQFLEARLKDPYSAVWSCQGVHSGYFKDAPIYGGKVTYGWRLMCNVNSKNSFGGYTGAKQYGFLFREGRLVTAQGEASLQGGQSYMQKLL